MSRSNKELKKQHMGQVLKKQHFALLLKAVVAKISTETVKNRFLAGGLYPFGPDYIDMAKIKSIKKRFKTTYQNEYLKTLQN